MRAQRSRTGAIQRWSALRKTRKAVLRDGVRAGEGPMVLADLQHDLLARQAAGHSEDIAAFHTNVTQSMVVELQQRVLNRTGLGASPMPESTIETVQRLAPE